MASLTRARRHQTRPRRHERDDSGVNEERLGRHAQRRALVQMGAAQPGRAGGLLAPAAGHPAQLRSAPPRSLSTAQPLDLVAAEPGLFQATLA